MSNIRYSFEFFPPTTDKAKENLQNTINHLKAYDPLFFSMTFGADGSDQEKTLDAVENLQAASNMKIMPHLTCIGSSQRSVLSLIQHYKNRDIDHLLALRGDMPQGTLSAGEFSHANELITFVREKVGDFFKIYVAAYPEFHPESPNPQSDINVLLHKFELGASAAITQFFFNADAYFYLRDQVAGAGFDQPLIPGIMPIQNYTQLARFANMCGAEIPRWMRMKLERFADDTESLRDFGHEVMIKMCERLIRQGVTSLHFYTLNQSMATKRIIDDLA